MVPPEAITKNDKNGEVPTVVLLGEKLRVNFGARMPRDGRNQTRRGREKLPSCPGGDDSNDRM
jgi:hypothetical protein